MQMPGRNNWPGRISRRRGTNGRPANYEFRPAPPRSISAAARPFYRRGLFSSRRWPPDCLFVAAAPRSIGPRGLVSRSGPVDRLIGGFAWEIRGRCCAPASEGLADVSRQCCGLLSADAGGNWTRAGVRCGKLTGVSAITAVTSLCNEGEADLIRLKVWSTVMAVIQCPSSLR